MVFALGCTGLGVGSALDGGVATVPQALLELASGTTQPATQPVPAEHSTSASVTPKATRRPPAMATPAPATVAAPPTVAPPAAAEPTTQQEATRADPSDVLAVHGRALDPQGQPVSGLFVYPGQAGAAEFTPAEPVAVTAKDGTFSLPCPNAPVLLTSWPLGEPAGALAEQASWAATFVGGVTDAAYARAPVCRRQSTVTDVVVQPGSALKGTVTVDAACDDGRALSLRLAHDEDVSVRLTGLRDGASFRIGGLPAGAHTLAVDGTLTPVVVAAGETVAADVTFPCDSPQPTPTPAPTTTSAPAPTPTPVPSSSLTSEVVSPTSSASPTPTGNAAISPP
jgi:hypothetical protein